MTLSRSAGAHTDAVLRIELGGLETSTVKESDIAPRLLWMARRSRFAANTGVLLPGN